MELNDNARATYKAPPQVTPKDFFLNLGWLITLYGGVISLLNILFETINRVFPDPLNSMYYYAGDYSGPIRAAIATLVVFFPIYVLITRYIRKSFATEPDKRDLWVRKWLVYLTLFLSILAIVIDLIVLINKFLAGDLPTQFLLKVLSTLVVAALVFGYYFYDLRNEGGVTNKTGNYFAVGTTVLVVASLVWAFTVIGSPMAERARRFDQNRVSDLQNIQYQIINYWQMKGKIPTGLNQLSDSISGYKPALDPETNAPYEYEATGDKAFRLCANFDLAGNQQGQPPYAMPTNAENNWQHGKGRACFDRTIDPELYPIKPGSSIVKPALPAY